MCESFALFMHLHQPLDNPTTMRNVQAGNEKKKEFLSIELSKWSADAEPGYYCHKMSIKWL